MSDSTPARVVLYTRVSTREQADGGHSLTEQRDRLEAWAHSQGCRVVGVCEDAGESGSSLARPGLDAALELLAAGEADTLAVLKLDRLARSTRDLLGVLERFDAQGWGLVFVRESLDTKTAAGRLLTTVIAALAEFELDQVRERTRSALAAKRSRGEWVGGVPLGMMVEGTRLVEDPVWDAARAEVVRLREGLVSFRAIPGRMRVGRPDGRVWNRESVRRLLVTR